VWALAQKSEPLQLQLQLRGFSQGVDEQNQSRWFPEQAAAKDDDNNDAIAPTLLICLRLGVAQLFLPAFRELRICLWGRERCQVRRGGWANIQEHTGLALDDDRAGVRTGGVGGRSRTGSCRRLRDTTRMSAENVTPSDIEDRRGRGNGGQRKRRAAYW